MSRKVYLKCRNSFDEFLTKRNPERKVKMLKEREKMKKKKKEELMKKGARKKERATTVVELKSQQKKSVQWETVSEEIDIIIKQRLQLWKTFNQAPSFKMNKANKKPQLYSHRLQSLRALLLQF